MRDKIAVDVDYKTNSFEHRAYRAGNAGIYGEKESSRNKIGTDMSERVEEMTWKWERVTHRLITLIRNPYNGVRCKISF